MSDLIRREDAIEKLKASYVHEDGIHLWRDHNNDCIDKLIDKFESIPSAEPEPIYMESVQAEAYNRGIDSERKRIADAWCKAEYERGYKDGRESAERKGEWKDRTFGGRILHPWWESCECSQCEEWGSGAWNYCPNCGCRMRKENE